MTPDKRILRQEPDLETQAGVSFLPDEDKQYLDEMQERYDRVTLVSTKKGDFFVPITSEEPFKNHHTKKRWIERFCLANNLDLPTDFYSKKPEAICGMFWGMVRETYKIPGMALIKSVCRN